MITIIEQQTIPGLEEYTQRVEAIKSAIGQSMIQMGGVLAEARVKFASYPLTYWEDWLRTIEIKPLDAERSIIAYQLCADLPQQLPTKTLKAIVKAPEEARVKARELLSQGRSIPFKEISKLIADCKSIAVGKTVYLDDDSPIPGGRGVVVEVLGEVVKVEIDGAIVSCFDGEISLSPPSQLSIGIPRKSPADSLAYKVRSLEDENLLLRATILGFWLQPGGDIRSRIEADYPHVAEWAGGVHG